MEGWETRVWAGTHPTEAHRMKGLPLPQDVIQRLSNSHSNGRPT
jgi:hypothetical protein